MIVKFELNATSGRVIDKIPEKIHNNYYSWIFTMVIDAENDYLYCFNSRNYNIMRMTTNGSNTETLISNNFGYVSGIAVDWSSDILYWIDSTFNSIEVAQVDGKHRKVLMYFGQHARLFEIVADSASG